MRVQVTQYVRPDGHQRTIWMDSVPDSLSPHYEAITNDGNRLAAEVLMTGDISLSIENPGEGLDVDVELCENGPGENGTRAALERLIARYPVGTQPRREGAQG